MSWRDPDNFFWNDSESLRALFNDPNTLTLDEVPWGKGLENVHSPVLK